MNRLNREFQLEKVCFFLQRFQRMLLTQWWTEEET